MDDVEAFAPGRVNIIGEHTDHTDGWCLPMAVAMGVTVSGRRAGVRVRLASDLEPDPADVSVEVTEPSTVTPDWARYVAGVVAEMHPTVGLVGVVRSDLPAGAGMSSSAALEVAVALALGFQGPAVELARLGRRAEHAATGVPCGVLDQAASILGRAGHAVLLDCSTLAHQHVPIPAGMAFRVVHSGQARTLAGSEYADRRADCEQAQDRIGPLRSATVADLSGLDGVLLRRARHVVTENARVHAAVEALRAQDLPGLGSLLDESHRSLRDDFEVSTPVVDALVERLRATPGVHGARIMGGGFGGCVVAVTEPGALEDGWEVTPGDGARVDRP